MELRQLECFLAVVRYGGFSPAAESLHLSQPAVSHSIAKLEKGLGVRLFDRIGPGRQATLTAAGEVLLPAAQRALDAAHDASQAVAATKTFLTGRLEVAALSYFVPPLAAAICALHDVHPGVLVALHGPVKDHEVIELIRNGDCELGLISANFAPPDLSTRSLLPLQLCALFPPGYDAPSTITLGALAEWPLIAPLRNTRDRDNFDAIFDAESVQPQVIAESEFYEGRLELVRTGFGATIGARAESLPAGRSLSISVIRNRATEIALVHRTANVSPGAAALCNVLMSQHGAP